MATGKSYFGRANYRFISGDHATVTSDAAFEFEESDIYGGSVRSVSPDYRKPISASSRMVQTKKSSAKRTADLGDRVGSTPSSMPVNVPDWSKILRDEYRDNRRRDSFDDDDGNGGDFDEERVRIPPHEFLARQMARTRIASFSVHEGIGRTLKGRDLSRVRNAIWEKTGFED